MVKSYKNLTVSGKTDGFGAQLNAKLSGRAYCIVDKKYRYIHTPFTTVSHGFREPEQVDKCNWIFPHVDNRRGKKIHVRYPQGLNNVFHNPDNFYLPHTLERIRNIYWSNKSFCKMQQIAFHIRRGDITALRKRGHWDGKRRWQGNEFYKRLIPKIVINYPDYMPIVIYSEGIEEDFETIFTKWPDGLRDRVVLKLGNYKESSGKKTSTGMIKTFQEMVSSEVLVQSRSSLSYCCGILNDGEVWNEGSYTRARPISYRRGLSHWKKF